MSYFYIALTILLTAYGQLVLKWQVGLHNHLMASPIQPLNVLQLLLKPWVISAFVAAFGASLCWMAALSRLPLSKAYPYMAINFFIIALFSAVLFREQLDAYKIAGTLIIMAGVVVLSRSVA